MEFVRPFRDLIVAGLPIRTAARERPVANLFNRPCVTICGRTVHPAYDASLFEQDRNRFRRDLARAGEIFSQCGIRMRESTFGLIADPALVNHPEWRCGQFTPGSAGLLFNMAECGSSPFGGTEPSGPSVTVFYVGSIGTGTDGCVGPQHFNTFMVSRDRATRNTFAQQLARLLLGGNQVVSYDPTNLLFTDSGRITVNLPRLTEAHCQAILANSTLIGRCGLPLLTRLSGADVAPAAPLAGAPASPVRELLRAAEQGQVTPQLVAMGQAILPELVMLLARDPDPAIRARAASILGQIGGPAAAGALTGAVRADTDPVVRLVAANALARAAGPAAEQVLITALGDSDPGVRSTVLRSLAALRTPAALMAIGQVALTDPNPQVRVLAGQLARGV